VNVLYDVAKKLAYFEKYHWIYWTDLASFTTCQSVLRADDGSVAYFPICQGTLPWQPNNVAKMLSTSTNTIYIRCTSARKRIEISWSSCARQQRIWCLHIVWKFREIRSSNSRVDRAHLWTSGMMWPKKWRISSNISGYTGLIFAIFSLHESALRADDRSVP